MAKIKRIMKKLSAKLALFIFISILLSVNLQAFAESTCADKSENCCITEEEKQNFIITIVEEPFGDAALYEKNLGQQSNSADFHVKDCCRDYTITGDSTKEGSLDAGKCSRYECGKDGMVCETVLVLFSKAGTTMIEGYIVMIYTWAASLVGLIAVTVIIISGIQISLSGGDASAVDSAKGRILKSISGLAVLFLSALILYTINPNFFSKL